MFKHNVDKTNVFWTGGNKVRSFKQCDPFVWTNNVVIGEKYWLPIDTLFSESAIYEEAVDACIELKLVEKRGSGHFYDFLVAECYSKKFFICELKDWL